MVERWTVYPKVARSTRVTSAFYKNECPYLSLKESDHFFIISFRDRSPMLAADHVAFAPSL